jgi:5-methyltetrahydropteroyltriglutamate--homocysteine methyltransferase
LQAPRGLGAVEEYRRLEGVARDLGASGRVTLKASIPGPYTLSGRLLPNADLGYPDRWALAEALLPMVRQTWWTTRTRRIL